MNLLNESSTKLPMLRQASQTRMPLKEKFVQVYEMFFNGEDPSQGNANFWDELFLLKVKTQFIELEIQKMDGQQLGALKETFNLIFVHCLDTLPKENYIRMVNAMQTICAFTRALFSRLGDASGYELINLLIGFNQAETRMQTLVERSNAILMRDNVPAALKTSVLQLLLTLATGHDNISQNTVLEYLMMNSLFESLIKLLSTAEGRQRHGLDVLLLLTVLVQYRKHESANPYIVKLSILDDELALNGFAHVIATALMSINRQFLAQSVENKNANGGFLSSLTSMVGNIFVAEDAPVQAVKVDECVLLGMYEAIYLNRNFITALTHSHAPTDVGAFSVPHFTQTSTSSDGTPAEAPKVSPSPLADEVEQPTNLLVTFLEYCSISLQDVRESEQVSNARLCLIILTCVAEDQYANSLMNDANVNFRVPLHKTPMRHRKVSVDRNPSSKTLASAFLDVTIEFIHSHLMKHFPMELYMRCLGIIHRLLCYQKKCHLRLVYPWKELWTVLITLLKFLLVQESQLTKSHDIFQLAARCVNVFNLFITYGDVFLPNPTSYDDLYYEIIRMQQVFDNFYSMAQRHASGEGQWKESAVRFIGVLVNIRAIVNHFRPKIDAWATNNHFSSLTEAQVLDVVRANYDTLTLKLQDNLDQYDRYTEKPRETNFFTQMVRQIVISVRNDVMGKMVQPSQLLDDTQHAAGNT